MRIGPSCSGPHFDKDKWDFDPSDLVSIKVAVEDPAPQGT